jgi:hypothetical protein
MCRPSITTLTMKTRPRSPPIRRSDTRESRSCTGAASILCRTTCSMQTRSAHRTVMRPATVSRDATGRAIHATVTGTAFAAQRRRPVFDVQRHRWVQHWAPLSKIERRRSFANTQQSAGLLIVREYQESASGRDAEGREQFLQLTRRPPTAETRSRRSAHSWRHAPAYETFLACTCPPQFKPVTWPAKSRSKVIVT